VTKNQAIAGSGPGATGQTKPEQLIPDQNKPQKEKDESDSSEDAKLAHTRPVSKPGKKKQPKKGSVEWENNSSGKSDVYSPEKIAIYVSMISSLLPPKLTATTDALSHLFSSSDKQNSFRGQRAWK
jgi:hypothetical protein